MKPLKTDPQTGEVDKDNPFGAVIKDGGQILDSKGKVSSAMNLSTKKEIGTSGRELCLVRCFPSRSLNLAEAQLDLTYERKTRTNLSGSERLLIRRSRGSFSKRLRKKLIRQPCISKRPICRIRQPRFFFRRITSSRTRSTHRPSRTETRCSRTLPACGNVRDSRTDGQQPIS